MSRSGLSTQENLYVSAADAEVHGAGSAPRQAQVLSAGRGMAARPILPALPAGSIAIPAGSIAIPAGSMLEVWFMEQGERQFQPGPAPRESMPLGAS